MCFPSLNEMMMMMVVAVVVVEVVLLDCCVVARRYTDPVRSQLCTGRGAGKTE